jgi:putative nucleotidyltransferase with HDIG domain
MLVNQLGTEMQVGIAKKRIVIVEDDDLAFIAMEKALTNRGNRIDRAKSVDQAMRLLQSTPFDFVVTRVRLPDVSGLDLLKWIKENQKIPVILLSEESDQDKGNDFISLGAMKVVKKTLSAQELVQAVIECFPDSEFPDISEDSIDHDFCRLSIDEFVLGTKLQFDMFYRVRDSKFVKISHRGEDIGKDRAGTYKAKNIQYLYVRKEDYVKLIELKMDTPLCESQAKPVIERRKIEFIKNLTDSTIQVLVKDQILQEDYIYAGALVMNSVNLLTDDTNVLEVLLALSKQTNYLYAHSVGVSLYSVLLARAMKIHSPPILFKIAVGGMLHDMGKRAIAKEILEKKDSELTQEDKEILNRHATEGAKILTQLKYVPSEVVLILHQHHENCLGTGFPSQLSQEKIHPSARIVSLANEFCHLTIRNPNTEGMGERDAALTLLTPSPEHNPDQFDLMVRGALKKIFKIQ